MPPFRHMDPKPCDMCHCLIERRRHPCGTLEKPKGYELRKFCSRRCHAEYRRREARRQQRWWRQLRREYVAA